MIEVGKKMFIKYHKEVVPFIVTEVYDSYFYGTIIHKGYQVSGTKMSDADIGFILFENKEDVK